MQRLSILLLMGTLVMTSGCLASRKYVRNTVNASSDALSARIDSNETEMKEIRDGLDKKITGVDTRVSAVDSRVSALDSKTTEGLNAVRAEVQNVDQKAAQAAGQARSAADRAQNDVNALGQKFQNRNLYNVTSEKTVLFKFDSARLEKDYEGVIDEVAAALMQNPDAIVVLEGRTDSVGDKEYNVRLGERRIEAVRRYLAVDKGVPVYKIHEISFGAAKPIAENKTREGREKNRAVTITVMVPKTEGSVASRND